MANKFELPKLKYPYNALEPNIDALTMEIHHTKHHNAYTTNLNNALDENDMRSIEEILGSDDMNKPVLRNNGGGFYNHNLFWEIMSPNGGGEPKENVMNAINEAFESFEGFKNLFSQAAATRFGSGWAWLCVQKGGKLEICSTPNQDNPLMKGIGCENSIPILALDVWEHAYYLNYQNRRPDYISSFFNVIDWQKVEDLYNSHS